MKVLAELAVLIVIGVLLVGCGSRAPEPDVLHPGTAVKPALNGRTYVVTGVTRGGKTHDLVADTQIRLAFNGSTLRITAGCNTMTGTYRLDGTRLTVSQIAGTEMGCDQARMDQDAWVAQLFDKPVQLHTGDDAALISGDVVLELADREEVSPDKPLAGTTWVLDGISDGDTAQSVPDGATETLVVTGDAAKVVNGCDQLDAVGTVEGNRIVWGPGRLTLNDCTAGSSGLRLSDGHTTMYAIEEDTLRLTEGDHGLTFRAR